MITEGLRAGDLQYLVKKVFDIDSYSSKIGNDNKMVVLSFTVTGNEAAKDLVNFLEMGYDFVVDSDTSPGETDDNNFRVYVEIERSKHISKQIIEMLKGISLLTGIDDMRFRYFKSFKSHEATLDNLEQYVPKDKSEYDIATSKSNLENFSNFFSDSFSEGLDVIDESISFKRPFGGRQYFEIVTSGPKDLVYESVPGPLMIEGQHIAEILHMTKTIGNYNISKIGNTFIFENNGWAVALTRRD